MNKKKIILIATSVLIIIGISVGVFITTKDKNNTKTLKEPQKIALTYGMINEIENMIDGTFWDEWVGARWDTYHKEYTSTGVKITDQQKIDAYTYKVYAKVYYKDHYGGTDYDTISIEYTAEKDAKEEKGYSIISSYNM